MLLLAVASLIGLLVMAVIVGLGCKSIRVKVLINIRVYVSIISSKVSSGSE